MEFNDFLDFFFKKPSIILQSQLTLSVWGVLSIFCVFLRSLCFPSEKVREIQEKLEAFIEALHKEK